MFENQGTNTEKNNEPAKEVEFAAGLVERIVGQDYFREETERLKEGDPAGAGMGRYSAPEASAPLAFMWLKAREELIFGELSGSFKKGYASARLSALGRDLAQLENAKNIDHLIKLLRIKETFELAAFTLAVASGYAGMGLRVEFCPGPESNILRAKIAGINTGCDIYCGILDFTGSEPGDIMANLDFNCSRRPVLLYLDIASREPVNLDHSLAGGYLNRFKNPGAGLYAVVPGQGRLSAGNRGVSFFRESRVLLNPGLETPLDFDIYLPR